jgi:hypothetical protein
MKKALFIGINYVGNTEAQLNGCIDDVTNMMTIITTYYGYDPNNIVMLTDASSSNVETLPTKANILQALQDLVNGSSDCEEMWIHYSGHGAVVSSYNGSAIVPVDYVTEGLITDMDLYDLIRSIRCKTMILMDSCNSGSMCNLEWNYEYLYGLNFMRTQLNSQQIVNPEIFMISGSKSNQPSAEIYDTESKEYEGAFTDAVLHVLKSNSYTVSLGKLMQQVCIWLVKKGITGQKPMLSSSSASPQWSIAPVSSASATIQGNFQQILNP